MMCDVVSVHIFAQVFTVCICGCFSNWCQKNMTLASSITTPYLGGGFIMKNVKYGLPEVFERGILTELCLFICLFLFLLIKIRTKSSLSSKYGEQNH